MSDKNGEAAGGRIGKKESAAGSILPAESNEGKKKIVMFYERKGAARAVSSSMFSFGFSIGGSILLWVYMVMATGSGALEYYYLTVSIANIFGVFVAGLGQSFPAKLKEVIVKEPENIGRKVALYSKIQLGIGGIMALAAFLLGVILPDPYLKLGLFMVVPQLLLWYFQTIMTNVLSGYNRYDITGAIVGLFGIVVFGFGYLFLYVWHLPGYYHGYMILLTTVIAIIPSAIAMIWVTPVRMRDIFARANIFSREGAEFFRFSAFSTLTNIDSLGVMANLSFFLTALVLGYTLPDSERLAYMQIFGIIIGYVTAKVVIMFFSGPVNVEIAEAISRQDYGGIERTINDTGRITFVIGLGLMTGICGLSGKLLKVLHEAAFISNGVFDNALWMYSTIFFIVYNIGQFLFGFGNFFGNILVGAGHADKSAIGWGIPLIITLVVTPVTVYFMGLMGSAVATLLGGGFIIPYMLNHIRRILKVRFSFRLKKLIPALTILFLILYFMPLGITSDKYADFGVIIGTAAGVFMFLLPFLGVLAPGDGELLQPIADTLRLPIIGIIIRKIGYFIYMMNPFHWKSRKGKKVKSENGEKT